MRTKYATDQQNNWIEEYLAIARPGIDKLQAAGLGGYWSDPKRGGWNVVQRYWNEMSEADQRAAYGRRPFPGDSKRKNPAFTEAVARALLDQQLAKTLGPSWGKFTGEVRKMLSGDAWRFGVWYPTSGRWYWTIWPSGRVKGEHSLGGHKSPSKWTSGHKVPLSNPAPGTMARAREKYSAAREAYSTLARRHGSDFTMDWPEYKRTLAGMTPEGIRREARGNPRKTAPVFNDGSPQALIKDNARQALKHLDYWKKTSDAAQLAARHDIKQRGEGWYSVRREVNIAGRIRRVANAFLKSPAEGMKAWMKNAEPVQEFFGTASRTMDDRDFQAPGVWVLHRAWTEVTDRALPKAIKIKHGER